jgi:hypothetical protein
VDGMSDVSFLLLLYYDKVRQSVRSKSESRKHGPNTGSHWLGMVFIRDCDWSMLFAFAFARNTSTHFVIQLVRASGRSDAP